MKGEQLPAEGFRVCICGKAFRGRCVSWALATRVAEELVVSPPLRTGTKERRSSRNLLCGPSKVPSANNSSKQACQVLL